MSSDLVYIAEHAYEIFSRLRWPEGPVCPYCGSHHHYICRGSRYKCKSCSRIYSIKTKTLLHGSHISVSYWLIALYLLLDTKGISSIELSRKLSITQKSAYYMLKRLRYGLSQEDVFLSDEIAMDEVYLGGSFSRMSISKRSALLHMYNLPTHPHNKEEKQSIANAVNSHYKTPVYGMNDGRKIVLQVIPKPISNNYIEKIFKEHTVGTGIALSDCSRLYDNWYERTGWNLETNNHSKSQYRTISGKSSNRIEGSFSWLKRSTLSTYVHFDRKNIQGYLNEFVFRWNNREASIEEKLERAIRKISQEYTGITIRALNKEEEGIINEEKINNPWEFFESGIVNEIKINGLIYRRADYESWKWYKQVYN